MYASFLLADMGGTNIRFACFDGVNLTNYHAYKCSDFETFSRVLDAYKESVSFSDILILAVPGNCFEEERFSFVNNPWRFSINELKNEFNFKQVIVVNDFEAVAFALPDLNSEDFVGLKSGIVRKETPHIIMGAGTGLGVGILLTFPDGIQKTLSSEAGHICVHANNQKEKMILDFIESKFGRVSAERLISGPGIENIYEALWMEKKSSEDIVSLAVLGEKKAKETILQMFAFWGDVAGDLALAFVSKAGVYLTGNIIQSKGMFDLLKESDFCKRFTSKGRQSNLVNAIPVFCINRPDLAFIGLKRISLFL